jgi:hypothetical protein
VLDLFQVEPLDSTPSRDPSPLSQHPTTHAFFTSWDEGRIIATSTYLSVNTSEIKNETIETINENKNENENETQNDNDLHNDTSENDIYLESLHFPDHMLENLTSIQNCFMYTRAHTLNAQRWRPYLA